MKFSIVSVVVFAACALASQATSSADDGMKRSHRRGQAKRKGLKRRKKRKRNNKDLTAGALSTWNPTDKGQLIGANNKIWTPKHINKQTHFLGEDERTYAPPAPSKERSVKLIKTTVCVSYAMSPEGIENPQCVAAACKPTRSIGMGRKNYTGFGMSCKDALCKYAPYGPDCNGHKNADKTAKADAVRAAKLQWRFGEPTGPLNMQPISVRTGVWMQ